MTYLSDTCYRQVVFFCRGVSQPVNRRDQHILAMSLCMMFNTLLKTACLPEEWKEANVTPVHKNNSKELALNYRPISLLCLVNKVLEHCIGNGLYYHIKMSSPHYNKVSCKITCVSQLLSVLHSIGKNLDNNIQTDILDFAKAFDSVDHATLLEKLKRYSWTST